MRVALCSVSFLGCSLFLAGCAMQPKASFAPPADYVPIDRVRIESRFPTVELTKELFPSEVHKCVAQISESSTSIQNELNKFPNSNVSIFGHASTAKFFLYRGTTGICLTRSSAHFPIFAAEIFMETVNPKGVPPDVVDSWYKKLAFLIASKGVAKVAYVYSNGNASIANYWVDGVKDATLYYDETFKKAGSWESEYLDAKFVHPSLSSVSVTARGNVRQKANPIAHLTR